jgi:SAM-dependent methyltransferase
MTSPKLKIILSVFKYSPLHPQWFSFRDLRKFRGSIRNFTKGLVLDIGCADKKLKDFISNDCQYIGLDYYKTSIELYNSKPQVYGDAQQLPFSSDCVETVTLLEVLEHLPNPNAAIAEAYRILKKRGILIITVPFLYPIHDAPFDFQRWTKYGLHELFIHNNFSIVHEKYRGKPAETAALICNIAATKQLLNLCASYNPLAIVILPLLVLFIPLINILGWFFSFFGGEDELMPFGYQAVLRK